MSMLTQLDSRSRYAVSTVIGVLDCRSSWRASIVTFLQAADDDDEGILVGGQSSSSKHRA
jgi:hypothetical protein